MPSRPAPRPSGYRVFPLGKAGGAWFRPRILCAGLRMGWNSTSPSHLCPHWHVYWVTFTLTHTYIYIYIYRIFSNVIRTSFCRFLKRKKKLVRGSNLIFVCSSNSCKLYKRIRRSFSSCCVNRHISLLWNWYLNSVY